MLKTVVEDWGLVDYRQALERQLDRLRSVQADPFLQYILLCSHPPIATLGRKTQPQDLFGWQGEQLEIQRGGRVTYHGPNQLVVYPIINLSQAEVQRRGLKSRDLHGYLRLLENAVVETLEKFGISSANSPGEEFLRLQGDVESTGVWVGQRKICSIGIGVKKWVTYHGLALNVSMDRAAFQGLKPCGFSSSVMTSMEEIMGQAIDRDLVSRELVMVLEQKLSKNLTT